MLVVYERGTVTLELQSHAADTGQGTLSGQLPVQSMTQEYISSEMDVQPVCAILDLDLGIILKPGINNCTSRRRGLPDYEMRGAGCSVAQDCGTRIFNIIVASASE